jgi:hypothetical protein
VYTLNPSYNHISHSVFTEGIKLCGWTWPHTCVLVLSSRLRLKCDGTRAEVRFRLSAKRPSPFKSAGASIQLTTGSRGVRISGSNGGYTVFRGSVWVLATHSLRQFPLHFPSRASQCAIRFQLDSNTDCIQIHAEYHTFNNKLSLQKRGWVHKPLFIAKWLRRVLRNTSNATAHCCLFNDTTNFSYCTSNKKSKGQNL